MSAYVVALAEVGSPADTDGHSLYGPFLIRSTAEAFAEKIQRALPPPPADGSFISISVWQLSAPTLANIRMDGWTE